MSSRGAYSDKNSLSFLVKGQPWLCLTDAFRQNQGVAKLELSFYWILKKNFKEEESLNPKIFNLPQKSSDFWLIIPWEAGIPKFFGKCTTDVIKQSIADISLFPSFHRNRFLVLRKAYPSPKVFNRYIHAQPLQQPFREGNYAI